jgi:hypothetical protein
LSKHKIDWNKIKKDLEEDIIIEEGIVKDFTQAINELYDAAESLQDKYECTALVEYLLREYYRKGEELSETINKLALNKLALSQLEEMLRKQQILS